MTTDSSAAGRKYLAASPPAVGAGYVRPEQRGVRQLWDEARAVSDDPAIQNQHWGRLMIANGHWRTAIWDEGVAHRILAQHGPGETCDACPCWHCGSAESDPDGDHSCPCPYHDNDCPWHRDPKERDTQ